MKILVNIGSDDIQLRYTDHHHICTRGNLENKWPQTLSMLASQIDITEVYVINGPGSFTNIRIGALGLNMFNFLNKNKIKFWNINKIDLYKQLIQNGYISQDILIYIGQKNNYFHLDHQSLNYHKISITGLNISPYLIDDMCCKIWDSDKYIGYQSQDNHIYINIQDKLIDIKLYMTYVGDRVVPEYILAPNIS